MNKYLLSQIPIVRLVIPLAFGIIFAKYLELEASTNTFLFVFLSFLIFSFFVIKLYKHKFRFRFRWISGFAISGFAFCFGAWLNLSSNEFHQVQHFKNSKSEYLHVKIIGQPQLKVKGILFQAEVLNSIKQNSVSPISGKLLVYLSDTSRIPELYYGEELIIPAKYSLISKPLNPYQFDYKTYMANKQIFHQAYVNGWECKLLNRNSGNSLIYQSMKLRDFCILIYKKYLLSPESVSLASTLVLGYRSDLSEEVVQAYQNTGTTHVLSVSGLHVGIIFVMLNFLLSFLDKIKYGKILKTIILIFAVWFYAIISGLSPAVNRAAVMLSFIILGLATKRSANVFNNISISALFLLIYDSNYLFDVGFQLSYIALSGIIYFQPKLQKLYTPTHFIVRSVWVLITVSIAAQIVTFPLSVYYFHQFPNYFLLSNLIVIPLATLVLYAGVFILFLNPFPIIATKMGFVLHYIIEFMNTSLAFIGNLPGSVDRALWFSTSQFFLLCISIILLISFMETRKNKYLLRILFSLLLIFGLGVYDKISNSIQKKIIFNSTDKGMLITYLDGEKSCLIANNDISQKELNFSTANIFNKYGIDYPEILTKDTITNYLIKSSNYLQINNLSIFCLNKNEEMGIPKNIKIIYIEKMNIKKLQKKLIGTGDKIFILDKRYSLEEEKLIKEIITQNNSKVHSLNTGFYTIAL